MKTKILIFLICAWSVHGVSQDGSFDLTFGDNGILQLNSVNNHAYRYTVGNHQLSDGSYLILSNYFIQNSDYFQINRITENGELDLSFGDDGYVRHLNDLGTPRKSVILGGTKILVDFSSYSGMSLKCFNLDGSLDTNFGQNGVLNPYQVYRGYVNVTEDGGFVVAINLDGAIRMKKYLNDGTLDGSFGNAGEIFTPMLNVKRLNDFKISAIDGSYFFAVRLHGSNSFRILKLNSNGSIDVNYGYDGFAILPNGSDNNCTSHFLELFENNDVLAWRNNKDIECVNSGSDIYRISYAGFVRPNFGSNGSVQTNAGKALIQENQRILFISSPDIYWGGEVDLKRYKTWGELDDAFLFSGQTDGRDSYLSMDNEGKIIVGIVASSEDLLIYRLANNPLGSESFPDVGLSIYPNPVNNVINIENTTNVPITAINLNDALGRQVMNISEDVRQVDLSHLNSGLFFLNIETELGNITRKIVKQ